MGKILDTQNLYRETLNEVTKSVENWQAFLDSSSWNFKYDFDDQILIYSQRPDAKACASMEEWNTKLKRWIKKGSNGIFVRDNDENSKFPFRMVFDVADTYNSRRTDYKLWEIMLEYENEIIDTLESNFGEIDIKEKNLANAIYLSAFNMVEDNIQDYLEILNSNKIGTKLEDLDSGSIETIAKVSAIASVSYMLMTRCGINPKEHIDLQDISLIEYFDKAPIISAIGNAVSDIAEQGLREIAKTVFELQKNEKIKNRTFEKNKNELYANEKNKEEGGIENGESHIHEGGRLQYPKFNNGEGEITNREIRKDEVKVSQGTQQTAIFDIMDGQETSRTSDGNSRNSEYESKQNSGADGERGEDNGGIKSTRPNEVGATYEQLEDNSRGDSSKGDNLRLTEYEEKRFEKLKTEEEQKIAIEKAKDRMVEYKFQQGFIEEFFEDNFQSEKLEKETKIENNSENQEQPTKNNDEQKVEIIKKEQVPQKTNIDVIAKEDTKEIQTIKSNIKRPKTKIQDFILHPEIPENERVNFKITDNELGVGTPKEKYTRDIEAIKVLKKCENENRYATKEEQEILSQYVGWGGLADAFDKNKTEWSKEYNELKELLNEEEYLEARESTLTAFYTPPIVIRAIYKALQNMGLKQANILEPSCGVGNFLGMIPKELEKCKMYGIEKDNISGRIAQQLYQKSTIAVQGYEKVDLPDSFFDVAVGNVPFGEFKVMDKRYDKYNFLIHDYFFRKNS